MSCLWLQFLLEWIKHNYFYLKSLLVECQRGTKKGIQNCWGFSLCKSIGFSLVQCQSMHDATKLMALCFSTCFLFEAMFSQGLAQWLNSSQGKGFIEHWMSSRWKKYPGCSYPALTFRLAKSARIACVLSVFAHRSSNYESRIIPALWQSAVFE